MPLSNFLKTFSPEKFVKAFWIFQTLHLLYHRVIFLRIKFVVTSLVLPIVFQQQNGIHNLIHLSQNILRLYCYLTHKFHKTHNKGSLLTVAWNLVCHNECKTLYGKVKWHYCDPYESVWRAFLSAVSLIVGGTWNFQKETANEKIYKLNVKYAYHKMVHLHGTNFVLQNKAILLHTSYKLLAKIAFTVN